MSLPVTNRPPVVPKKVILFGFLLGLSLALLGLIGSHLVGSLNENYMGIVTRQLPSLGLIREISQAHSAGRRLIETAPFRIKEAQVVELEAAILKLRHGNGERLDKLERLLNTPEASKLIGHLRSQRINYHAESDQFLQRLKNQPTREIWESQRSRMFNVDQLYVKEQDRVAEYCEQTASARSAELTRRSRNLTLFFFVVAAWPLILAVGFFLYGLISTLALFYRSRSHS